MSDEIPNENYSLICYHCTHENLPRRKFCANCGFVLEPNTKVVNIRFLSGYNILNDGQHVYIGRSSILGNSALPGVFGNPFPLTKYSRDESLEKFTKYFLNKVDYNEDFKEKILSLFGKTLVCYCKPLECHGDIIIEWLERNASYT